MSESNFTNKQKLIRETNLVISNLCKNSGIERWVLFGGGKIHKSARTDEYDSSVLAVALEENQISKLVFKEILVPVGALGLIMPRRIIQNGHFGGLFNDFKKGWESKKTITIIDPTEARIVRGDCIAGVNALSTLASLKDAPFVEMNISIDDKAYLSYVSCFEVFRFYYGSSNGLLNTCLMDDISENIIFNPNAKKKVGAKHFVQLRKNLYDVDALVAGRIRFNSYAQKEFENIKGRSKRSYKDCRWITCKPPIEEKNVQWKVSIRSIAPGKLLISNIHSCGAKAPFDGLVFGRDNDGRTNGSIREIKFNKKKQRLSSDNEREHSENNEEKGKSIGGEESIDSPNAEIETELYDFTEQAGEFTGFNEVPVEKITKTEVKTPFKNITIYEYCDLEEISKLATSKAKGKNSKVGKIDITATKNNGTTPADDDINVISMSTIVVSIANKLELHFRTYVLDDYVYSENSQYNRFPFLHESEKGEKKNNEFNLLKITFLDVPDDEGKTYQFAFVDFYDFGKSLEKRSALMINMTDIIMDDYDEVLKAELRAFRADGRSWSNNKVAVEISKKHRLVHSGKKNTRKEGRYKILSRIVKFEPKTKEKLNQQLKLDCPNTD